VGRCSSRRPASSSRRHWTALDRGGACSIAGIHLSDVPSLDYSRHLYQERELRSVTANTREDAEAAEAHVQPRTTGYALADANRALRDMKHSNIEGTPVLVIAAGES
jgi:alcohol dehydrogenase, propanol-preferring